jgi:hypothetical protein
VGTVPVFNEGEGTIVDFQVDLTFAATGPQENSHAKSHISEPGFLSVNHFQGLSREATATGIVFGVGINFTPDPSTFAVIQKTKSGSILIIVEAPE